MQQCPLLAVDRLLYEYTNKYCRGGLYTERLSQSLEKADCTSLQQQPIARLEKLNTYIIRRGSYIDCCAFNL